jgi:hypothetical protein
MSAGEDRLPQFDLTEDVDAPTGSLDAEGIPDHEGPLPQKEATGDGQDGIVAPGDRPWAAEDHDVTAEGQREGSTLDERLSLEEPDRMRPSEDAEAIELVDEDRTDDEPAMVGDLAGTAGDVPAEELAMHVTEDPPGATDDDDDGYVAEDGGMAP